jgi:hypothetical protein
LPDYPDSPLEADLQRHADAIAMFIAQAKRIPTDRFALPRASGKWTPGQEVVHLVLTYTEFAAILAGSPEFTLLVPEERAAEFRRTVLPRILAGGWFPSGAAAPVRTQPEHPTDGCSAAVARLATAADVFHAAARTAAVTAGERHWRHPYFGPLPLRDFVVLLTEHVRHHARFLPIPD